MEGDSFMDRARTIRAVSPWFSLFSLFGLLGFLPKHDGSPNYFFFIFFGFLAFFFWHLLEKGGVDERLLSNRRRAGMLLLTFFTLLSFLLLFLLSGLRSQRSVFAHLLSLFPCLRQDRLRLAFRFPDSLTGFCLCLLHRS